jgi:succinoglycan biosynthesis protein ExoM
LKGVEAPFRPEFGNGGEDVDFFRRMAEQGCAFVWCNEAVVYEVVPSSRCKRRYLLKRALLNGSNSAKYPKQAIRNATKSLIAIPAYVLILPVIALLGQHLLIRYSSKLLYHAGRLLAFLGVRLVTQRQA